MCGITALFRELNANISVKTVEKMMGAIYHRGPDDNRTVFFSRDVDHWQSSIQALAGWRGALGSRRLSIQDVSNAGHMPMSYHDRFWVVHNERCTISSKSAQS